MRFHFPIIINKKELEYHLSKKNHSFYNDADSPKLSFPITKCDVIERFGYYIVGLKKDIAYMKTLNPNELSPHLKKQVLQGCKEGKCDL